jgi:hypothetical protein
LVYYCGMEREEFKGTPGPWRWELNKKSKDLNLCGRGECGPYDFYVMSFERWGMGGAVPTFREGKMNSMVKAFEFGKPVEGRLHHSDWFQDIDHPDARLIAAAPELLKALQNLVKWEAGTVNHVQAYKDAKSAINKALGNEAH